MRRLSAGRPAGEAWGWLGDPQLHTPTVSSPSLPKKKQKQKFIQIIKFVEFIYFNYFYCGNLTVCLATAWQKSEITPKELL